MVEQKLNIETGCSSVPNIFLGLVDFGSISRLDEALSEQFMSRNKLSVVFRSSNRMLNTFNFKYQISNHMKSKVICNYNIGKESMLLYLLDNDS